MKCYRREAKDVLVNISNGSYTQVNPCFWRFYDAQYSIEELSGFREALLELCNQLIYRTITRLIYVTGGDGKDTFNISTLALFIAAGAGV
jgi:anthranilate phosphoribosyltransferase